MGGLPGIGIKASSRGERVPQRNDVKADAGEDEA